MLIVKAEQGRNVHANDQYEHLHRMFVVLYQIELDE
jgi:hypothetical protein